MTRHTIYLTGIGIFLLIIVGIGFSIVGSPISQQAKAYDAARLSNFTSIQYKVEDYYKIYHVLPKQFSDLTSTSGEDPYHDPLTKKEYGYFVASESAYQLCAEFSTQSDNYYNRGPTDFSTNGKVMPSYESTQDHSSHPKGYYCMNYTIPSYLLSPTPTPYVYYENLTPSPAGTINSVTYCSMYSGSDSLFNGFLQDIDLTNQQLTLKTLSGSVSISYRSALLFDKTCKSLKSDQITFNDSLRVEVTTSSNNIYQGVQIQDLSR